MTKKTTVREIKELKEAIEELKLLVKELEARYSNNSGDCGCTHHHYYPAPHSPERLPDPIQPWKGRVWY